MEFFYEDYLPEEGLGQMKEIVDSIYTQAENKVKELATAAGEAAAQPVAAETKVQFKDMLPWMIVGFVAVTAMGGLFGGMGVKTRSRR